MDEQRFDSLARSIGALRSRRRVLTVLPGAVLAGRLGLPAREAAAAPKPGDATCSRGSQCASGTCIKYGKCKKNGKLTGKCRCGCTDDSDCNTADVNVCRNGACFWGCSQGTVCPEGPRVRCTIDCDCWPTDLGSSCMSATDINCDIACTTSDDCPIGQLCIDIGPTCGPQCARKFCVNPCGRGAKDPTVSSVNGFAASPGDHRTTRQGDGVRVDLTALGR